MSEAEALLLRVVASAPGRAAGMLERKWAVWTLLHRLMLAIARDPVPEKESSAGCIILIHAFPTEEIRRDTAQALQALEKYYFQVVGVTYPLVIFADAGTAAGLERELRPFTSAPIVPAVIPMEELAIPMASYSCVNGLDCQSGLTTNSSVHRGVLNGAQFWSPDYLRISRYTAGRLFLHEALNSCGHFLKMDTDFFFTAPVLKDPLAELRRESARLAYWQIHVQGQRQAGYMEAAVEYLKSRNMRIKNMAFYARGRFEEKAERLGIPLSEVPEALEAATVVYGCLFGGEVRFFREPLYQDFFKYMDERRGFETAGWSNQFFLGTAAAAFLFPSQVRRLYISGRHQESKIDVADGNVTEYLTGASKSVFR